MKNQAVCLVATGKPIQIADNQRFLLSANQATSNNGKQRLPSLTTGDAIPQFKADEYYPNE